MTDCAAAVEKLKAQFPDAVLAESAFLDERTVAVKTDRLLDVCRFLRDDPDLRFTLLTDVTGVDYRDMGCVPRFGSVYHLYSLPNRWRIRLKTPAAGDPPTVPSVASVWAGADWAEREAYDLMGITFKGHPDLRRIMLPDDWVGHPLRKDFAQPTETVQFTPSRDDPQVKTLGAQLLEAPSSPPAPAPATRTDTLILNMGPQHPATHGVLRVVLELDGETVVNAWPDIGHLHSGIEKTAEQKTYWQITPYTDRMDYATAMTNNLGYVMTVEKLLQVQIPERAQALRVILCEMQRLASHLLWLGTQCLDLAGTINALLMYAFSAREEFMNIIEMVSGARLTPTYIRVGGLARDVPNAFVPAVRKFLRDFERYLRDMLIMLDKNPIWLSRLQGVGKVTAEEAVSLGATGPVLRSTGVAYDVRKYAPYSGYQEYEFDIPTGANGDCYDRYLVRVEEMRQSVRIIRQALDRLPEGPVVCDDRKIVLPPREELDASMEALIHQFKLVTEGFAVPVGEAYASVEGPKGELGYYLVSSGGPRPYRLRIRGPSFYNLQACHLMGRNQMMSDMVAIIGSIDITLGEVDR